MVLVVLLFNFSHIWPIEQLTFIALWLSLWENWQMALELSLMGVASQKINARIFSSIHFALNMKALIEFVLQKFNTDCDFHGTREIVKTF